MICSSCLSVCMCVLTYKGSDAASTDSGLEVALQLLLDGAGGVKALSQQDDGVDKEEGGNTVDDVLKDLNPEQKEHKPMSKMMQVPTQTHTVVSLWQSGTMILVCDFPKKVCYSNLNCVIRGVCDLIFSFCTHLNFSFSRYMLTANCLYNVNFSVLVYILFYWNESRLCSF